MDGNIFLHAFLHCAFISLMLNWRSNCWMHRQRSFVRSYTAQEKASFSLLNNLVLFTGQNSINSESAGWFPHLLSNPFHGLGGNKGPGIKDSLQSWVWNCLVSLLFAEIWNLKQMNVTKHSITFLALSGNINLCFLSPTVNEVCAHTLLTQ